jgi:hypothetical protein
MYGYRILFDAQSVANYIDEILRRTVIVINLAPNVGLDLLRTQESTGGN